MYPPSMVAAACIATAILGLRRGGSQWHLQQQIQMKLNQITGIEVVSFTCTFSNSTWGCISSQTGSGMSKNTIKKKKNISFFRFLRTCALLAVSCVCVCVCVSSLFLFLFLSFAFALSFSFSLFFRSLFKPLQ